MSRGGAREGAGRKAGKRNNKTTELQQKTAESGILPLDYMLAVMRDEKSDSLRRDGMAKAAAPFLHAKLTSTEVTGKDGGPMTFTWLPPQE